MSRLCISISFLAWGLVPTTRVGAADRQAVDRALSAMKGLVGPGLQVNRSEATGTVTFLAAPGKTLPVVGALTSPGQDRARAFVREYAGAFGLGEQSGLEVTRATSPDKQGFEHVRLQQTHRGVPVTGAELTVHLRDLAVVSVLAKTVPDLDSLAVVPGIEPDVAERAAREGVAKDLAAGITGASAPRLEVLNRGLLEGGLGPNRLAWFVEVTGEGLRDFVWIDAQRGVTLLRFSQLPEARNRHVYTARNGPDLPGARMRSEGEPATGDLDGDAAFDSAGDAYDYFQGQHGRDSYDAAGAPLHSTVHFCPTGAPCPYPNAAWTGTQMVYGEGFSRADDVGAHELTHAVVEHTANLFYYMQSGALNESIADIFGETIDLTNSRGNDDPSVRWQMGEDVPGFGAIRHMMNPNQFGDPASVSDPLFSCSRSDNGGVHSNSGVSNRAYALMVDGGQIAGTTVSGIGLVKAGKVVYRALVHYLTSASNLIDFSLAAKQACSDLVGGPAAVTTGDCLQVKAALEAVAMESAVCGSLPRVQPELCPSPELLPVTVFEDNLENPYSGNWMTTFGSNHWTEGAGNPDIYFTGYATSGQWSFWGFGAPAPGDSSVATNIPHLGIVKGYWLMFRHSYGFEFERDGGVVEFAPGGFFHYRPFTGAVRGATPTNILSASTGNPLGGRPAFTGQSHGYTYTAISLDEAEGIDVSLRFRIGTDSGGSDIGWFIDDVKIYLCGEPPTISVVGGDQQREGDSGTPALNFSVTRSLTGFAVSPTVDFEVVAGTPPRPDVDPATPGVDFVPISGRLTFPVGVFHRNVSVPVIGDYIAERQEAVDLVLSNPVRSGLGSARGTDIIENDDAEGFTVTDAMVVEPTTGTVNATFEVALTPPGTSGSVSFQTRDGTATAPVDYTSTTGTLSFDAGNDRRLVTVPVKPSASSLSPRTFDLALFGSSGPAIARTRGTASIYERGLHVMTPCRLLDTRLPEQGPPLATGSRTVVVGGGCTVPPTAKAVALNLTVVDPAAPGHLTVFPSGTPRPTTSTINFSAGQTRANNALVPLGPNGRLEVTATLLDGQVDVIVDVTGFFE